MRMLLSSFFALVYYGLMMTSAAGLKILMFSDSFERYMLFDRCSYLGLKAVTWTDDHLTYIDRAPGGWRCAQDASNSVSSFAVFGSNATRPYHYDGSLTTATNIVDTKERIHYALNHYLASFPPPDFLFVHTVLWDTQYFLRPNGEWVTVNTVGHPDFMIAVAQARKNYIERMEELYAVLKTHQAENITRLALRSATYYPKRFGPERCEKDKKHIIEGYNDMLRELAREHDWTFFDLDAEVWSTTSYDYSRCDTLRDDTHIALRHSLVYGKKLMGTRHSAYFWLRGQQPLPSGFNVTWLHPTTRRVQKEVFLVKAVTSNASSSSSSPSSPLHAKPNRLMPGSSLAFFTNSTLLSQYQRAEEAFEEDLFFVSYDQTGQNPVLHAGAGPHFRLLLRLGEGDIYEAAEAEIEHLPLGHRVPTELNQPDVWQRGVIVHIPQQHGATSEGSTPSTMTNADVVGTCDEWYFVVRGSKHPIHVISDFAVRCKGPASRAAQGQGSIPLSTIFERLERVPQLTGRKRCRIHTRQFLAELVEASAIHVPSVSTENARQPRTSRLGHEASAIHVPPVSTENARQPRTSRLGHEASAIHVPSVSTENARQPRTSRPGHEASAIHVPPVSTEKARQPRTSRLGHGAHAPVPYHR